MRDSEQRLTRARRQAVKARARLTGTLVEMQSRLRPTALFEEAMDELREKATETVHEAVNFAKERPATVAGLVTAALVYLFRNQLFNAAISLFSQARETGSGAREFHDESGPVIRAAATEKKP